MLTIKLNSRDTNKDTCSMMNRRLWNIEAQQNRVEGAHVENWKKSSDTQNDVNSLLRRYNLIHKGVLRKAREIYKTPKINIATTIIKNKQ